MKRTIEIEDSLDTRVQDAIQEVKKELLNYLGGNEPSKLPCLRNKLDYSGSISEIVDGAVPIYTKEINDTWFLYSSELEQAYENAGCGSNPRENNGMAAIYHYIDQKISEWYDNEAEEIFDGWRELMDEKENIESEISDLRDRIDELDKDDSEINHRVDDISNLEKKLKESEEKIEEFLK